MANDLHRTLKYVFTKYHKGGEKGFSNIEPLKLIPSLLSYYGNEDMPDSIKNEGNALRSLLVKIELFEESFVQVQKIPDKYTCVFRNEDRESQTPQNFSFSPQIHISGYPTLDNNMIEEIQTELSSLDILGMLIYIKEKASEAGDFEEAINLSY